MEKIKIPRGDALVVYQFEGPWDKGVSALKSKGLDAITLRDLAEARILGGANSSVSTRWTWVAENFNYDKDDILIASREFSPLLQYPVEATECHRQGKEFYLSPNDTEKLRRAASSDVNQAMKFGVLLLKRSKILSDIPVEAFGEEDVTSFLFRDKAKEYGRFLKENGIKNVPLYVVDKAYVQKQAFSRALWAYCLYVNSALNGDDNLDSNSGRVSGVRRRGEPEGRATAPQAPRAVSGLVASTLEQVLALSKKFPEDISRKEFEEQLKTIYRG
ncbi:MAG: hypothetical protein AABX27_04860 [Nanoarchaeota archaeon]